MTKNWPLLVLITYCLLANCLQGQDKTPIELPVSAAAAIDAMPIQAPVAGGNVFQVIDGETKKPIANAEVIILNSTEDEGLQARARSLQKRLQKQVPNDKQARLILFAMLGTRYQTDAAGNAKIPGGDSTYAIVVSGTKQAQWTPRQKGPLELFAPRHVTVQVFSSRGKPARNVEVGLGTKSVYFRAVTTGKTDASGMCTLQVDRNMQGRDLQVQAMIASHDPVEAGFQADAIPQEPVQLRLPPCGQVRFILYGEDERPSSELKRAVLNWTPSAGATRRGKTHTQPTQLDTDGAMFSYVALGLEVSVSAFLHTVPEALRFTAKGPTREHEMIIVDGRINTGPPIISFRVLDQKGQPLRDEALGKVLYSADSYDYSFVKTNSEGQITIALQEPAPESIYLMRRSRSEGSDYRGAVQIELKQLKPGKQELTDATLEDEPVIASGTLVDAAGNPVAGVWLRSKSTIVSGGNGGGSSGQEMWYHTHRVQTDEQGHFAFREVAPVNNALQVSVDSKEWAPLDDTLTLNPGDKDETFRVGIATQLEGELLGELNGMSLNLMATERTTGKETRGYMRNGTFLIDGISAGSYDISFGRSGDYKLEDVKSKKKGEPQDPRLRSAEWSKHFQIQSATVTDENDKPLENITVWFYVSHNNGRHGNGKRTDANGKASRLAPLQNSSIEVKPPGYEPQVFKKNLGSVKIKLIPVAAIDVQIVGMPKMPAGVYAQATLSTRIGRITSSSSGGRIVNGKVTVQPRAIGKCTLKITLGAGHGNNRTREVRNALRRAINHNPITFELSGTRKPTEPKIFKLDQDTIDSIQLCLDDAREVLKQEGK